VAKESASTVLSIGGQEVQITNPEKLYFSSQIKVTKLALVQYYLSVAPGALAGIQDRPIVLKRFVNGAEAEAFYQKRAPEKRPAWLRMVTLSFPSGRTAEGIVVDDAAGLAWIVNALIRLVPSLKPDCACAFRRKARTLTAFAAEESVLCSPV
jgi:bifunctional non-homologous end joining protein LigD